MLLNVSLLQLEYQRNRYRQHLLTQIWALLLLLIFASAMAIEGFHNHGHDQSDSCNVQVEKTKSATQLKIAKTNCKLCEIIKHRSHFYYLPPPLAVILPLEKPLERTFSYLEKHPVSYILSAANKGPPSLG